MLLCGKKIWDVWSRNESVGQKLVKFCTHTDTHTHAAKLVIKIACAPSIETFKSRLIEAISTGAIVVACRRGCKRTAPAGILRRALF